MTTKPVALLSFIRGAETTRGYDDYSTYATLAPPKPVTQMTVNEVRQWQSDAKRAGSKSVAIGGYQIISKTFDTVAAGLKLTGDELFDAELQDRMAMSLLEGRGFTRWQAGAMTDDDFAANLSKEWASLPTASGKSHYAGDGLNAATVGRSDLMGALSSTKAGKQIDLSGFGIAPQGAPAQAAQEAARAKAERMSLADINQTSGGASLKEVVATPPSFFRTEREEAATEAALEAATPGLIEAAGIAIDEQWVANTMLRQIGQGDFAPDPNFQFSDELWAEVTEGLPEGYHEVFGEATSAAHARALAESTRNSFDRDVKLAQLGWGGIGLQVGAAILDPVALAATAATEGALGPVIYGAKISRLSRAVLSGTTAAATNMAVDGYLISQDPVGRWSDLAYSAAGGFLIGGAVGAYRASPVDTEMQGWARGYLKAADAEGDAVAIQPGATAAPDGSVGAMRVPGAGEPADAATVVGGRFANSGFSERPMNLPRIDMVGSLRQSENGITRQLASVLDEDAVGTAGGGVTVIGANERAVRDIRRTETRFFKTYNPAFKAWAKEAGYGLSRIYDPAVRGKFNWEVGKAVRRPLDSDGNPHVQKVAAKIKEELAGLLEYGRENNLRGFHDIKTNDLYLMRQHRVQAIDDMIERWGSGPVHQLVAESLISGNRKWRNSNPSKAMFMDELSYEDALTISKSYLRSIRSRKYGQFDLNRALAGQDVDTLRNLLQDEGVDAARVEAIVDSVRFSRDSGEVGREAVAKHRLNLDETAELSVLDPRTGQRGTITIEDMLENDAEQLFRGYAHSVIRSSQVEQALAGFKVPGADGSLPAHAPSYETIKGYIAQNSKLSGDAQRAEFAKLDTLYRAVKGIPQEPEAAWRNFLRRVRDFNFIRVMGQLGIAQTAELGMILGQGGVRAFFGHMPALRHLVNKAQGGQWSDALSDEIEAIFSHGTDVIRSSPAVRLDDGSGGTFDGRGMASTTGQRLDFMLGQGKQAVAHLSGMSIINTALQRWSSRVLVQRFIDNAFGSRAINSKRFRALGINEVMADRINSQITRHVRTGPGLMGRTVKRINIEAWDDIDAKNAFINGVDRWARRTIQENNPGSMPAFMSKEMGKTIMQFRSFMLAAYTKQLLSGMAMRDWETAASFLSSMFFGGLFYVGQTHVNSIGRPDREEWLAKQLSPEAIGKAAFQRAGFSTFIPMMVDIGASPFTDEPVFAYRTTGLSTGIWGNPSADLLDNTQAAIRGIVAAASRSDYDFSQQDWRAVTSLLPLQNAFVIRNVLASIGGALPRFSQ